MYVVFIEPSFEHKDMGDGFYYPVNVVESKEWCRENCKGEWFYTHSTFGFILKEDAVLFKLTWA